MIDDKSFAVIAMVGVVQIIPVDCRRILLHQLVIADQFTRDYHSPSPRHLSLATPEFPLNSTLETRTGNMDLSSRAPRA
jgi:hypothetical protein